MKKHILPLLLASLMLSGCAAPQVKETAQLPTAITSTAQLSQTTMEEALLPMADQQISEETITKNTNSAETLSHTVPKTTEETTIQNPGQTADQPTKTENADNTAETTKPINTTQPAETTKPADSPSQEKTEQTLITLTYTSYTFSPEETKVPFTATSTGTKGLNFYNTNPEVAIFDGRYLRPVGIGTTVITASDGTASASCTVTVTGFLTLNISDTQYVLVGDKQTIEYEYSGNQKDLVWTSSDTQVLKVTNNGVVTMVSPGDASITVTDGVYTRSCNFLVRYPTSGFFYSNQNAALYDGVVKYAGDSMKFWVDSTPYPTNPYIRITSSNPSVVSISEQYQIYYEQYNIILNFRQAGSSVITLTSEDGNYTQSFTIHVRGGFQCDPGKQTLTAEEFAYYATRVGAELGQRINERHNGYRYLYLSDEELTWDWAKKLGMSLAHENYSCGIKGVLVTYQGKTSENGQHLFFIGY